MTITTKPNASLRAIMLSGVIGNALECYDFALYGYFSPIIAHLFFPQVDKATALIATFTVFAIGFFMRPLGAILFGHFGDRWGRKKVLAAAVITMALATAMIGLLPTYAHVGAYAGYLLTACRLAQGLAVGGEYAGSIVFIVEHAPQERRGFFGSWALQSMTIGMLLSSGVAALIEHYVTVSWAWRIPFLLGILAGAVGLYLRLRMPETPLFEQLSQQQDITKRPLMTAIKQTPLTLLKGVGIDFLPAAGFYLIFIYLSSYLNLYFNVPLKDSLTINTISLFIIAVMTPLIGYWSDIIGRKKIMLIGGVGFLLFSYPLFLLLIQATYSAILIAQVIFAVLMAFCCSILPVVMAELFPTHIRYTGVALPYNLSNALLGGTAPLVATVLIHNTKSLIAPSFYIIFAAMVFILVLSTVEETYTKKLH